MKRLRSACLGALLVAVPSAADASPLLQQAGPIGDNAGFQGVVSGPGAASTYFNPALLADAEDELLLGFAVISEQVGITLDGRNGGDVPLSVGNRNIVVGPNPIPNNVVPTQWLNQGCPPGQRPDSVHHLGSRRGRASRTGRAARRARTSRSASSRRSSKTASLSASTRWCRSRTSRRLSHFTPTNARHSSRTAFIRSCTATASPRSRSCPAPPFGSCPICPSASASRSASRTSRSRRRTSATRPTTRRCS